MSSRTRLAYIQSLLDGIGRIQLFRYPRLSDQIFELYCYFRKLKEFIDRGKTPICISKRAGYFSPHFGPGHARSADYFRLADPLGGEVRELILNGQFIGDSGVYHSPDIVLTESNENRIVSIYECKDYSGTLGPGIYRDFIGYCKEMGLLSKANQARINGLIGTFPELAPSIFTSGPVNKSQADKMKRKYNFNVFDNL